MHISEGVLSAPVLVTGGALAVVGTAIGLKSIDYDKLPRVAVLSAAFFVASLIHIPIGPVAGHLVLNGIVGLLLGWAAFPSILVALALQALLFQYGGIIVLGVNTVVMALPAVICHYLFRGLARSPNHTLGFMGGFGAGLLAVALSGVLAAAALFYSGDSFFTTAAAVGLAHIPVMIAEGFITGFAAVFITKVRPALWNL